MRLSPDRNMTSVACTTAIGPEPALADVLLSRGTHPPLYPIAERLRCAVPCFRASAYAMRPASVHARLSPGTPSKARPWLDARTTRSGISSSLRLPLRLYEFTKANLGPHILLKKYLL